MTVLFELPAYSRPRSDGKHDLGKAEAEQTLAQANQSVNYQTSVIMSDESAAVAAIRDLDTNGKHPYQPLDTAISGIRLLYLGPGKGTDPLLCTLKHASLQTQPKPQYQTISYVWGNPNQRGETVIESIAVSVPASSERVLRRLRSSETTLCLWIDAICINQDDLPERGQQVGMMAAIYKNSMGNIVHLGEDDHFMQAALKNLHDILEDMRAKTSNAKNLRDVLYGCGGIKPYTSDKLPIELDVEALSHLYSSPWFGRLWVFQEATLAPNNTCVCGSFTLDLLDVVRAARWLQFHYRSTPAVVQIANSAGFPHAVPMFDTIDHAQGFNRRMDYESTLFDLLLSTQKLVATDPRDHLFGVFGLLEQRAQQDLLPGTFELRGLVKQRGKPLHQDLQLLMQPNYTLSLPKVMRNATRLAILDREDLKPLDHLTHRADGESESDFCSWTVRWDRAFDARFDTSPYPLPLFSDLGLPIRGSFAASLLRQDIDGDVLSLLGVEGGEVSEVGEIFKKECWDSRDDSSLLRLLCAAEDMAFRTNPGFSHFDLRHVLCTWYYLRGKTSPQPKDYGSFKASGPDLDSGLPGDTPAEERKPSSLHYRYRQMGDEFQFIGNAYVHGLTNGEIGEQVAQGVEEKVFRVR
ncbi:Uu.00g038840.m01.CDS01 [Anthostomella pinea]|uniref:Uu.00g038840.m01.CDS01 n=1 Tax=Anthostomella pinea TaxID=933095 RepID=A0AAI8YDP2_9PEZI|nr:Uu.00g038840.m01.CDS01 [Anthostomella pinea]